MKNRLRLFSGPLLSGGMKMTKYVHCTVVETRVGGQIIEDPETSDGDPYPRCKIQNNAYQMRPSCYHNPTIIDFRA